MTISKVVKGTELKLETSEAVFSPSAVDCGTLAMLSQIDFKAEDKVLDLGCGYGVVGILAAKQIGFEQVVMCDISEEAVQLSAENAATNGVPNIRILVSDGLSGIPDRDFSLILSNPPYHTDFSVAKHFIEEGYSHLKTGGRMIMVTKRLLWYKNKLTSVFGGVQVKETEGYYVFISEKRKSKGKQERQKTALSKKLQRKYAGKTTGGRSE